MATDTGMVTGCATLEGTTRYRGRFPCLAPDHFRQSLGLWLSSIGLGTYLGGHDRRTDDLYREAIAGAVAAGSNVIDTAINYRYQRSERAIGETLQAIVASGLARRDELVICTKGGYLAFDDPPPSDPRRWVDDTFITPGIIAWSDIVSYNVMHPAYIRHEIETSLENLRLACIDVYYLHNPETQLEGVTRREFLQRIRACCEQLERAVSDGKIGVYGTATWNGYRISPNDDGYLSLEELVDQARAAGGEGHHFKAIQVPFNLAMAEAFTLENQRVGQDRVTTLAAASRLGIAVFASASLLQAKLARLPAPVKGPFPDLASDAQRALQFVRSAPGITTALVGMKEAAHVDENLALARHPCIQPEAYAKMYRQP